MSITPRERLWDAQLPEEVLWSLDRAGDKLGVEHDVKGVDAKVFLRLLTATIHLYHIAEALEGVERQPNGQDDVGFAEQPLVLED